MPLDFRKLVVDSEYPALLAMDPTGFLFGSDLFLGETENGPIPSYLSPLFIIPVFVEGGSFSRENCIPTATIVYLLDISSKLNYFSEI